MKKLLCFALLLGTSMAHAHGDACIDLKITIKNNTPFACQLVSSKLIHGITHDLEHLPLIIQSGEETETFIVEENPDRNSRTYGYAPKAILSYACGDGHSITLESTQTHFLTYTKTTIGKVISSEQMDANFTTTEANCWERRAGTIHWILN